MKKDDWLALGIVLLLIGVACLLFVDIQVKNTYVTEYRDIRAMLLNYTETENMTVFCEVAAMYCYNIPQCE